MREILFRGKATQNREWVYGDLLHEPYYVAIQLLVDGNRRAKYVVDPSTVGQYTGLTDKNGMRIFEGDICTDGRCTVRVHWHKHGWYCEVIKGATLSERLSFPLWQWDRCRENGYRELEAIGNVCDNPELLEGKA